MLTVQPIPEPAQLRSAVTPALADYRIWRGVIDQGEELKAPIPVIRNAFPRWLIPRTADLATQALSEALIHDGHWHLQIHVGPEPTYYARVRNVEQAWLVEWFGEKWLAAAVDRGLSFLEGAPGLEGELRLVSSRLYEFTSFWLPAMDRHLVVSASWLGHEPTLKFVSFATLEQEVLARFGIVRSRRSRD
jgi:hypothetical protein